MVIKTSMKGFVWILLAFMLILSSFTLADDLQWARGDWASIYGDDSGRSSAPSSNGGGNYTRSSVVTVGTGYTPLAIFLDSDDIRDIFIMDGSTARIYNANNYPSIQLKASTVLSGSLRKHPVGFTQGVGGSSITQSRVLIDTTDYMYDLEYNGSTINIIDQWNHTADDTTPETNIACARYGNDDNDTCYWLTSTGDVIIYYTGNQSHANLTNTGLTISQANLVAGDIDSDGKIELGFVANNVLKIFDTQTLTIQSSKDVSTCVGGYSTSTNVENLIFADVDNTGLSEVVYTCSARADGGGAPYPYKVLVEVLNYDLTDFGYSDGGTLFGGNTYRLSNIVFADVLADAGTTRELCYTFRDQGKSVSLRCMSGLDGTVDVISTDLTALVEIPTNMIAVGDLNLDGYEDLGLSGSTAFTIFYPQLLTNLTQSFQTSSYIGSSDLDGDGTAELLLQKASSLTIVKSDFVNAPPVLNNSLNGGGYTGYYTGAICKDTTITFRASDCDGASSCNYENDVFDDTERIVTNCGQLTDGSQASDFTTGLDNGTFSSFNPTYQCFYNVSGLYSVRLYLQDDENDADFSQYNTDTININVIDGIEGITCNQQSLLVADVGDIPVLATTDEALGDFDSLWDSLFNGSEILKFLLAMILIIGAIFATTQVTQNSFVVALVGVLVMGGCTVFGILSAWIMIIFLISMVLLLVMKATLFTNSE